jgi:hypothetical protein
MGKISLFRCGTFLCLLGVFAANAIAFTPNDHPSLVVPKLVGDIKIDGIADEPGWAAAAVADNFCETRPGDQTEPAVGSEVRVTYDDTHLYLLFTAFDDPSQVRATMVERDNIFRDDYFGAVIDTYGDKAWAYELFVNPYGIQGDLRWTNNGEDESFDIVWESEGNITAEGWQVEVAIPFRSLRFPRKKEQTWLVTFWRDHPRESRRKFSWAKIDRDNPCWLCNFGTLTGIENVQPGGKLDILPSVIATESGAVKDFSDPSAGFDNADPDAQLSLNMRYAVTTDLSAEGTINPDFSQVESDASQIDVNSTTALFYPERRPFFQEGSDLFSTWIDVVYTRSINDPKLAGKLYGRVNRTSVAFVAAQDENAVALVPFEDQSRLITVGRAFSNIFRLKQTIGEDSFLGTSITDRRWDGDGSGSIFSADGFIRILKNYSFEFQVAGSNTAEPNRSFIRLDSGEIAPTFDRGKYTVDFDGESFWGHSVYVSPEFHSRHFDVDLDYWEYSPGFRADNGFVTRNNSREGNLSVGYGWQMDDGFIEEVYFSNDLGRKWNFEKEFKDEWLRPGVYFRLKGQTEVDIGYLRSREQFRDTVLAGIRKFYARLDSRFSQKVAGGAGIDFGREIARRIAYPVMGKSFAADGYLRLRPNDRIVWSPEVEYFRISFPDDLNPATYPGTSEDNVAPGAEISATWVFRNQINYQFNRRFYLRLILEYFDVKNSYDPNDSERGLSVEPLLTYQINPFTIFYIGSVHQYDDFYYSGFRDIRRSSQQFFAKLQYLFRT